MNPVPIPTNKNTKNTIVRIASPDIRTGISMQDCSTISLPQMLFEMPQQRLAQSWLAAHSAPLQKKPSLSLSQDWSITTLILSSSVD
jgi:hypothetical protein